jgi:hypothetical protein
LNLLPVVPALTISSSLMGRSQYDRGHSPEKTIRKSNWRFPEKSLENQNQ